MNKIIQSFEVSEIRKISDMAKAYHDAINLSIGEPHLKSPSFIKHRLIKSLKANTTTYAPASGTLFAKEGIKAYIQKMYNIKYSEAEILVTNGATGALNTVLKAILNPDDEVIIFEPAYNAYEQLVKLHGGKIIKICTKINEHTINPKTLEKHISARTKAIIINYPNNPLGTVLSQTLQEKIIKIARKNQLFLICDEVYSSLTIKPFISMGRYRDVHKKLIIINSFSKSHNMTGYRLGFVLANQEYLTDIIKVHNLMHVAINTFTQDALKVISCKNYQKNRKYYLNLMHKVELLLEQNQIEYIKPDGTFYVFVKVNTNSQDFVHSLLKKYHVAVTPGYIFGANYHEYIRISCSLEAKKVLKGLNLIMQHIKQY